MVDGSLSQNTMSIKVPEELDTPERENVEKDGVGKEVTF